jgi:hypothetical protein
MRNLRKMKYASQGCHQKPITDTHAVRSSPQRYQRIRKQQVEGNWQESRQACKSLMAQAYPYLDPCADIYVGMRAVRERAFWENIVQVELRRSSGCSMEAATALRSEKLACFDTHRSGAGPSTQTFNGRLDLSLSINSIMVRPHLAGAGGEFSISIRFDSSCTSNS